VQILLALIFGATYGAALHFLMPGREARGAAFAPVLGAVLGGLVYAILTWVGVTADDLRLWLASLGAPIVVVPLVLIALTRSRATHDARERLRLGIA